MSDLEKKLKERGMASLGRFYGNYHGLIMANDDPKHLARIKVKVPFVTGEDTLEEWAFPKGMPCGSGTGLYLMPNVGDAVWVEFIEGDPRKPIWNYGWWGNGDMLEDAKGPSPKPTATVWQSADGMRILIDDAQKLIRIQKRGGRIIEINEAGISLGSETKSAEPLVLGLQNAAMLTEMNTDLQVACTALLAYAAAQITAATALPLLLPLVPGLTALQGSVAALQAMVGQWLAKVPSTLSKVNTTD